MLLFRVGACAFGAALLMSESAAQFADLAFFKPAAWPAAVYLTSSPDSLTPETEFFAGETVYLDFAFANFGSVAAPASRVDVQLNGESLGLLQVNSLAPLNGTVITDATVTGLPVGTITLTVVLDALDEIEEQSEGNNTRSLVIEILSAGCSPADLAPPFDVINRGDVLAFLDEPQPTVAEPTDAFDFADVLLFLELAEMGCPID